MWELVTDYSNQTVGIKYGVCSQTKHSDRIFVQRFSHDIKLLVYHCA